MKIQKAFKFLLKPSKKQIELFFQFAGSTRYVFNNALAQIKVAFEEKAQLPTYTELAMQLPKMKRAEETMWLKRVHSQILQQSLKDLDGAMSHFFRRLRNKKKPSGFPRFKRKGKHDSFRYPQGVKVEERHLYLPKIGNVRYKRTREIEGTIKQVTVVREGDRWFVAIIGEYEKEVKQIKPALQNIVGIDLGLKHFAYTSSGEVIANPRILQKNIQKLRIEQRKLSRKKKGSNNRKKAVKRVAQLHTRVKNSRKDFLHKLSTKFVKNHDVVAVEDLNVSGMIRNRHLARSIADVGWHTFQTFLKYKFAWSGKYYVEIGRFEPSSKKCSSCGSKQHITLAVRVYRCNNCGLHMDRDFNASINIRAAGISVLQNSFVEFAHACGGSGVGHPSEAGISGF